MTELDELRVEVALTHGLDAEAAALLGGTTVEEIEAQAVKFAGLVATATGQKHEQTDVLVRALDPAARAQRKAELQALFTARPAPARDEAGRFARRGGFDGGARASVPARRSPGQAHDEMIVQLAGLSRTFGGGGQSF